MAITAQQVKALRDRTGAGMMDCKNALEEVGGDEEKAVDLIQKKGLAKVAKKAGAIAAEGVIHAYIHAGSRIGVLVEVNCQTDFVARSPEFLELVNGVGLQIASMTPQFVRRSDITADALQKQKEIFLGQMDEEEANTGKKRPAEVKEKIVLGKLDKWQSEICLDEQPAVISEEGKTIAQLAEELSAKIGEKIAVRRFVRYELGEGIEKKKTDFAAEIAETLKGA
ncbi:MAG: translation elongation factor Ts [Myxococcales bacterium]